MEFLAQRCPWYIAGPYLGLVVFGLQWMSNLPLGVTGSIADLKVWLARPVFSPTWRVYFLAGIVLGALGHTLLAGNYAPSFAYGFFDLLYGDSLLAKGLVLSAAGVCIGFGAHTAGGCTSGHGICGMSRGSVASLVSTLVFIVTAMAVSRTATALLGGAP